MKWIEETAATVLNVHAEQTLKRFATGCIMLEVIRKIMLHITNDIDAKSFLAKHHYCCCLLVQLLKPSPDCKDSGTCKEFQYIQTGVWSHRYYIVIIITSMIIPKYSSRYYHPILGKCAQYFLSINPDNGQMCPHFICAIYSDRCAFWTCS